MANSTIEPAGPAAPKPKSKPSLAGAIKTIFSKSEDPDESRAIARRRRFVMAAVLVLYLRGDKEGGDIEVYLKGFVDAGVRRVERGVIPGAGHFAPEEAPEAVWREIASFIATPPGR